MRYRSCICHRIFMTFGTEKIVSPLITPVKFEENRFRFRYSSHIYVSPDFSSMRYKSCICHRILMKFGTEKFSSSLITSAKFKENRFRFRYRSHIYVSPDISSNCYRSCICHRIYMKFDTVKFPSSLMTPTKY